MRIKIPYISDLTSALYGWSSEIRKFDFFVRGEEATMAREVGPFIIGVGAIVPFLGVDIPQNWSILGVTLYVAEFPELAKVLGAIPPSTTFSVPTAATLGLPALATGAYLIKVR